VAARIVLGLVLVKTVKYNNAFWGARATQAVVAAEQTTHPLVKQVLEKVAAASAFIAAQPAVSPRKECDGGD
jgi:hypothetical protein